MKMENRHCRQWLSLRSTIHFGTLALKRLILVIALASLVACGGESEESTDNASGNNSSDDNTEATEGEQNNNTAPVSDAGPDQVVALGATVELDGSGSFDVDGDTLAYNWSLSTVPPGSSSTVNDLVSESTSFVADQEGTYVLQLFVNDGTVDSSIDSVVITAVTSPLVEFVSRTEAPELIPEGLKITCSEGPDTFGVNAPCPILKYNGLTYWAYSFVDNRGSLGLTAYDSSGNIAAQWELVGARYVWDISVDTDASSVTFYGQATGAVSVSFTELTP